MLQVAGEGVHGDSSKDTRRRNEGPWHLLVHRSLRPSGSGTVHRTEDRRGGPTQTTRLQRPGAVALALGPAPGTLLPGPAGASLPHC